MLLYRDDGRSKLMAKKRKKAFSSTERKRSIFAFIFLSCAALVILGIVLWTSLPHNRTVTPIGTACGLEITREELLLYVEEYRAEAAQYFAEQYGARVDNGFWTASFGGEIPSETVKKKALDALRLCKAEQKLMLEYGVIQDAGYTHFLQELSAENQRRATAVSHGDIIYGPEQYKERDYFLLLHEKRKNELLQAMEKAEPVTEAEKRAFYERSKQEQSAFLMEDGICRDYEDVELLLEKKLVEQRYQKYLTQILTSAEINIDHGQYQKITID